jgi:hypothetical protein
VELPPDEGERKIRVLILLASLCDVWAACAVLTGNEEPAGWAQLLAVLLFLAAYWWPPDGKS